MNSVMVSEKEFARLEKRFGKFERATFDYKSNSPGFANWLQKLMRRRGEIVLVVPRRDRVLLHTKPHYPANVFRLPTGGIHPGEDAVDAARREGYEEIGSKFKNLRLLGILDN